jgi:hypothetical protein
MKQHLGIASFMFVMLEFQRHRPTIMYLNWEPLLFPCILPHNNNGNSVPMRPDSILTMATAFPRVSPRNDHCCKHSKVWKKTYQFQMSCEERRIIHQTRQVIEILFQESFRQPVKDLMLNGNWLSTTAVGPTCVNGKPIFLSIAISFKNTSIYSKSHVAFVDLFFPLPHKIVRHAKKVG